MSDVNEVRPIATLADSFRDVAAKLKNGTRGVQIQSPSGGWFSSYDKGHVAARRTELLDTADRLEYGY